MSLLDENLIPLGAVEIVPFAFSNDEDLDGTYHDSTVFRSREGLISALRIAAKRGGVSDLSEGRSNHCAALKDVHGNTLSEIALDEKSFGMIANIIDRLHMM